MNINVIKSLSFPCSCKGAQAFEIAEVLQISASRSLHGDNFTAPVLRLLFFSALPVHWHVPTVLCRCETVWHNSIEVREMGQGKSLRRGAVVKALVRDLHCITLAISSNCGCRST